MHARVITAGVVAAGALAGAAALLLRDDEPSSAAADHAAQAAAGVEAAAPAPPPVSDDEAQLLAEVEEDRAAWDALRDAYAAAPRKANAESEARLRAALGEATATATATAPVAWTTSCRASLCRISADAAPLVWHALLRDAPPLRAVAERIATPPRSEDAAYVALAPAAASRGHDLLRDVETEFLQSNDARYCLSSVDAVGRIAYDLRVDSSGYTFRVATNLPRPVVECVNDVLSEILRLAPVPPGGATLATRSFGIHR